ncbi:MAG: hypothetical protein CMI23_00555 [Opitutae bacterium]|nr:hypothetical protein [Opitutae bacterium]
MNLNPIHRRSALKQLGLSTLSLPILSQTSTLFAEPEKKSAPKQRLIVMFSPNGTIPDQFWPDKTGEDFEHKTILKPLEPFHDKMLVLKNLHNKVRGDGDNHMRGMSCLLTGIELFPGNVMGGGNTPSGWPKGISIDREICKHLQSKEGTRTRFGALHFGVGVQDTADPWTRMSYDGPNQPVTPLADPYDAYRKLYGNVREKKQVRSVLDDLKGDLHKVANQLPESDRKLLIEHSKLVERMDKEYESGTSLRNLAATPPELPEGLRNQNDSLPQLGRLQIDMMVNSFVNDFARVATLQYTKSVGQAKMNWLEIDDAHHTLSHEPDKNKDAYSKLVRINTWFAQELAYLLKKLESTPEPGQKGSMLDHTLVIWTNELGKGNSHTLNNIPFVLAGNGFGFRMGRSMNCENSPHNRFLLSLAHAVDHPLETFGNPAFCQGGPLDLS